MFTIVDASRHERYAQPVGCLEPFDGGWHVTISWVTGVPCKAESKERAHAFTELADLECTETKCRLPRPGTTFRSTLAIDAKREPRNHTLSVQAIVNVLRHEPPFLFLTIETTDAEHGVTASGTIRVKLYKRLADKVDPDSWRP